VPVTYKIDADKRTVRTKCIGLVTLQEVTDHFRTLDQDSERPDLLDVLLDLSEVESLPDTHEISAVIAEMKRIQHRLRFGACAIVANRDALLGMMRIFEALAEELFRVTCTFRAVREAEAWLVAQQSLTTEGDLGARGA
jgi:hypothetical protein